MAGYTQGQAVAPAVHRQLGNHAGVAVPDDLPASRAAGIRKQKGQARLMILVIVKIFYRIRPLLP